MNHHDPLIRPAITWRVALGSGVVLNSQDIFQTLILVQPLQNFSHGLFTLRMSRKQLKFPCLNTRVGEDYVLH